MYPRGCAIQPSSPAGKRLGFFDRAFALDSYLWIEGKALYIPFIESNHPGKGDLSRLFKSLTEKGFEIRVPTPFAHMEAILQGKGCKLSIEIDKRTGELVEVWVFLSEGKVIEEPEGHLSGFRAEPIQGWARTKFGHMPVQSATPANTVTTCKDRGFERTGGTESVTMAKNGRKRP